MLKCTYIVERIDGDYAMLRREDETDQKAEPKMTARALLPPEIRDEEGVRYDKAVGIYLRGDAISFHSYSASWDGEYGYTFPDGGVMSWLDVRVEYRNGGRFALSEPYAPEGQEGYLEDYRKMMEQ